MSSPHVTYFYDSDACSAYFSEDHPMVPERVNMTHELVQNYNLFPYMEVVRYHPATATDLKKIHLPDYIDYLKNITPSTVTSVHLEEDCPIFPGLYDFTSRIVGSSLGAANKINEGTSDICINWSGGMHHAKKRGPSGYHKRVMYIDIDVHHGDGVQEFFYDTNRVMTISFHQYGSNFFPGTGGFEETGIKEGKNYAINVPLKKGINDRTYHRVFTTVIEKAMERYQPEALVLQMGADSVSGDTIGDFNLSSKGHSACMEYALKFYLPTIILGGGGYSIYNVPRIWTLETGNILGQELSNELPENSYLRLNSKYQQLRINSDRSINRNSAQDVNRTITNALQVLENSEIAPSVPLKIVPSDWQTQSSLEDLSEDLQPDIRFGPTLQDAYRISPLEYYRNDLDNDRSTMEWSFIPDSLRSDVTSNVSCIDPIRPSFDLSPSNSTSNLTNPSLSTPTK